MGRRRRARRGDRTVPRRRAHLRSAGAGAFFVNLPVGRWRGWSVGAYWSSPGGAPGRARLPRRGPPRRFLAALVLGISRGADLGLDELARRRSFRGASSSGHLPRPLGASSRTGARPDPVPARSFTVANLATLLYAMGFFAMLLGNILFLTSVWHYSILRPAWRLPRTARGRGGVRTGGQARRPHRVPPGAARRVRVFAGGLVWYAPRVGLHRAYLTAGCPPPWSPASASASPSRCSAPPPYRACTRERFAVGSAVNQTARQVGGALGIALLVVILGTPSPAAEALPHSATSGCSRRDRRPFRSGVRLPRPERQARCRRRRSTGRTTARLRTAGRRGRPAAPAPDPLAVLEASSVGPAHPRPRRRHGRSAGGRPGSKTVTLARPRRRRQQAGRALPGMEFLEAIRDGVLPRPAHRPHCIGLRHGRDRGRGGWCSSATPDESAYNPIGMVHGGLACTLADTVVGCAVHTTLEAGTGYTSIDLTGQLPAPGVTSDERRSCGPPVG